MDRRFRGCEGGDYPHVAKSGMTSRPGLRPCRRRGARSRPAFSGSVPRSRTGCRAPFPAALCRRPHGTHAGCDIRNTASLTARADAYGARLRRPWDRRSARRRRNRPPSTWLPLARSRRCRCSGRPCNRRPASRRRPADRALCSLHRTLPRRPRRLTTAGILQRELPRCSLRAHRRSLPR